MINPQVSSFLCTQVYATVASTSNREELSPRSHHPQVSAHNGAESLWPDKQEASTNTQPSVSWPVMYAIIVTTEEDMVCKAPWTHL